MLTNAQVESTRLGHNYIGTEHLFLGLLALDGGTAAQVLRSLGVDREQARGAVELIVRDRGLTGAPGLTSQAKRAIELAVNEVRLTNASGIRSEHLLLGLVAEDEGIAAAVLQSVGVTLQRVRAAIARK